MRTAARELHEDIGTTEESINSKNLSKSRETIRVYNA